MGFKRNLPEYNDKLEDSEEEALRPSGVWGEGRV